MTRISPNQTPSEPQYRVLRDLRTANDKGVSPSFSMFAGQALRACQRRGWMTGRPGAYQITTLGREAMTRYEGRYLPRRHTPAHTKAIVGKRS